MVDLQNKKPKQCKIEQVNIGEVSIAGVEQDIDYIFHVDCELPMELYTKLEKAKKLLVGCVVLHSDAAVRRKLREMKYTVAKALKDSVGQIVMESLDEPEPEVVVHEGTDLKSLMEE